VRTARRDLLNASSTCILLTCLADLTPHVSPPYVAVSREHGERKPGPFDTTFGLLSVRPAAKPVETGSQACLVPPFFILSHCALDKADDTHYDIVAKTIATLVTV
jgi:hypothetical protein